MNYSRVHYQVDQRVCTISLRHMESRNALDETAVRELSHAFVTASKDNAVKAVVLTGTGSVFCTGEGPEYYAAIPAHDFGQNVEEAKMIMRMMQIIYTLRKPVLARVNGPAHGIGCLLAAICDFAVSSEKATFGFPEVQSGLIQAIAVPFLVKKIGEGRTRELMLRGNLISAAQAKIYGLVTATATPDYLDSEISQFTKALCTQSSSLSMGMLKEMFAMLDGMKLAEALEYAANMHAAARMTEDGKRGIEALAKNQKLTW
ncbi:MAG: enoyl-CoA hydratase/isomerase family protein [Acidobacteriota bacterium]